MVWPSTLNFASEVMWPLRHRCCEGHRPPRRGVRPPRQSDRPLVSSPPAPRPQCSRCEGCGARVWGVPVQRCQMCSERMVSRGSASSAPLVSSATAADAEWYYTCECGRRAWGVPGHPCGQPFCDAGNPTYCEPSAPPSDHGASDESSADEGLPRLCPEAYSAGSQDDFRPMLTMAVYNTLRPSGSASGAPLVSSAPEPDAGRRYTCGECGWWERRPLNHGRCWWCSQAYGAPAGGALEPLE